MDRKTILELVRKVKSLADRGIGGEAISAKIKLKRLYEKYNLTDADFVELQESYNRYFIFRHEFDKTLLFSIICMIVEKPTVNCGESNKVIRVKLTDEQYTNIVEAYEYYQKMFDDYSKYLMQAMISRNAIGYVPKSSTSSDTAAPEEQPKNPSNEKSNNEFDMVKLMKIAVALDANPWKKITDDKNLPLKLDSDSVGQHSHAKTRDDSNHTK